MIIRKVSKEALAKESYLVWNEFVNLLAMEQYADLDDVQRVAYLCFWYDSEVQNGGHLQYFENQGTVLLVETLAALHDLGAERQRSILAGAIRTLYSKPRSEIQSIKEFSELALKGEYNTFDEAYYGCEPSVTELLEEYLRRHQAHFVEVV